MKTGTILLVIAALCIWGCRKDKITTDPSAKLEFSVDTAFFDTVFTSVGSTTQKIKVFNRSKHTIKIAEIKLAGGPESNYQININGVGSHRLRDIELRGNDSLNVFVKVSINPSSSQLPFIVKDSIEFFTNGNDQKVILTAYGQNAVFLNNAVINTDTVWDNKLPYVIYNSLSVSSAATLTIEKGSRIYFHKDAEMRISGTLRVDGELSDSVSFASDRLEEIYEDEPGQWGGLRFLSTSKNNHINYAHIRNGITGIRVDSLSHNSVPKLLLTNTIVQNMELAGLYFDNTEVAGFNNLVVNCGRHLIYAVNGGKYNFKQNTFANTSHHFSRTTPSLFFTDHLTSAAANEMDVVLINNIIWGNLQDELVVSKKGTLPLKQIVRNNLIKSRDTNLKGLGNIINEDLLFKDKKHNNFTLTKDSPAANKGENLSAGSYFSPWLSKDLTGRTRLFPSDLGCYELL